jgi:hypothetical protein
MNAQRTGSLSVVAAFIAAFLCTLALLATPQLHERLHKISDRAAHNCAVTLVASGGCDDAVVAPPLCQPHFKSVVAVFPAREGKFITSSLAFSLLEHAPPSLS